MFVTLLRVKQELSHAMRSVIAVTILHTASCAVHSASRSHDGTALRWRHPRTPPGAAVVPDAQPGSPRGAAPLAAGAEGEPR